MKLGADEVRHVARLAELAVAEEDVALLAQQLEAIVEFVEQLAEVEFGPDAAPVALGPEQLRLRDDVVNPIPMTRGPSDIAPAFEQGFFVVPKLGGLATE